jgi:hypothetical protein
LAVIVTVAAMRMVKMSADKVVYMVTVRDRLMATSWSVHMCSFM